LPESALASWDRTLKGAGEEDRYIAVRQAIASARGDLDQFLTLEARRPEWRQDPLRAAEKLLAAGRFDEALSWARREHRDGFAYATETDIAEGWIRRPHDLQRVDLEARILEAKGDSKAAQTLRWRAFETTLDPAPLQDYLKKLGDFEEYDEIARAFSHVEASPQIYLAQAFFVGSGRASTAPQNLFWPMLVDGMAAITAPWGMQQRRWRKSSRSRQASCTALCSTTSSPEESRRPTATAPATLQSWKRFPPKSPTGTTSTIMPPMRSSCERAMAANTVFGA